MNPTNGICRALAWSQATLTLGCVVGMLGIPSLVAAQPSRSDRATAAVEAFGRGDYAVAGGLFTEAAEETEDPAQRARLLNNACVVYNNISEYRLAFDACSAALQVRREQQVQAATALASPDETSEAIALARTLNNYGLACSGLGRHVDARAAFIEARALNRKLSDLEGELVNETNLAAIDQATGLLRSADTRLSRAEELLRTASSKPWAASRAPGVIINRSVVLERLGRHEEALQGLRALLEADLNERDRAYASSNLGVMYRNLGDAVKARFHLQNARALYENNQDRAGLANTLLNLARVYAENLSETETAQPFFHEALELARQGSDPQQESEILLHLGRSTPESEQAKSYLAESLQIARKLDLIEGIESATEALGNLELREGRAEAAAKLLEAGVDEVRSRQIDPDQPRSERFLGDRRRLLETTFEAGVHSEGSQGMSKLLALAALAKPQPQRLRESQHLTLAQIANQIEEAVHLPTDFVALEFFAANETLYRLSLSEAGKEVAALGKLPALRTDVRRLHQQLERRELADPTLLQSLAEQLLPHWETPPRRLLIANDDVLRYLPFDLLPLARDARPLVTTTRVRSLPSLAWLGTTEQQLVPEDTEPLIAAFGALGSGRTSDRGLRQLRAVEAELDSLREAFDHDANVEILRPGNATREAVLGTLEAELTLAHFAMHAELDDLSGPSSYLILDPAESSRDDDEEPPVLRPQDIRSLRAAPKLTVLSACSTASGGVVSGWGLDSMVGAFLGTGGQSVVASLWKVDDEAAAVFMEQFYWRLARGESVGEALRETKGAMRSSKDWSSPSDWAAFVLIGEDLALRSPIRLKRLTRGLSVLLLSVLLVALLLAVVIFVTRRRSA